MRRLKRQRLLVKQKSQLKRVVFDRELTAYKELMFRWRVTRLKVSIQSASTHTRHKFNTI
jgi:hypothetical protein